MIGFRLSQREVLRRLLALHERWEYWRTERFIAFMTGDQRRCEEAGRCLRAMWTEAESLRRMVGAGE